MRDRDGDGDGDGHGNGNGDGVRVRDGRGRERARNRPSLSPPSHLLCVLCVLRGEFFFFFFFFFSAAAAVRSLFTFRARGAPCEGSFPSGLLGAPEESR